MYVMTRAKNRDIEMDRALRIGPRITPRRAAALRRQEAFVGEEMRRLSRASRRVTPSLTADPAAESEEKIQRILRPKPGVERLPLH